MTDSPSTNPDAAPWTDPLSPTGPPPSVQPYTDPVEEEGARFARMADDDDGPRPGADAAADLSPDFLAPTQPS